MNRQLFSHSIRAIAISTLVCGLAFLAGCNKEPIKGEAFIGLKSGETLRISDMQVWFFDESFIEIQKKHAAEYRPKVAAVMKEKFAKESLLPLHFAALGLIEGGAISKTRTDSNGQFLVPSKAKLVLAFYERESPEEQIVWSIPISPDQKQISLSASNAALQQNFASSDAGMSALSLWINVADDLTTRK